MRLQESMGYGIQLIRIRGADPPLASARRALSHHGGWAREARQEVEARKGVPGVKSGALTRHPPPADSRSTRLDYLAFLNDWSYQLGAEILTPFGVRPPLAASPLSTRTYPHPYNLPAATARTALLPRRGLPCQIWPASRFAHS